MDTQIFDYDAKFQPFVHTFVPIKPSRQNTDKNITIPRPIITDLITHLSDPILIHSIMKNINSINTMFTNLIKVNLDDIKTQFTNYLEFICTKLNSNTTNQYTSMSKKFECIISPNPDNQFRRFLCISLIFNDNIMTSNDGYIEFSVKCSDKFYECALHCITIKLFQ
jgi:hypothetical protein